MWPPGLSLTTCGAHSSFRFLIATTCVQSDPVGLLPGRVGPDVPGAANTAAARESLAKSSPTHAHNEEESVRVDGGGPFFVTPP